MRTILAVIGAIIATVIGMIPGTALRAGWRHVAQHMLGICDPLIIDLSKNCPVNPTLFQHFIMNWLPTAIATFAAGCIGAMLTFVLIKRVTPRAVTVGVIGVNVVVCALAVSLLVADGVPFVFVVGRASQELSLIAGWLIVASYRMRALSLRQVADVF